MPIYELNIKEQTKEILGVIYINWWSNDIEKAKYKRQIIELEEIREKTLREKYNPDTIFEKQSNDEKIEKIQDEVMQENNSLIIVNNNENIFKKIINKIIKFFKNKK